MAEQVIFELSVLFGESIANPNRMTWRPRNSNSQYRSPESRPSLRRIESESEPPNLATETNADHGTLWALNPPSPVRMRQSLAAKTPRNRGDFSGCARVWAGSLCNCRLGGGASRIRTLSTPRRIWSESKSPDFAVEIRTCSTDLLSPALHCGESKANPNRPTWQQRKTRAAVSSRPGAVSLRFGYARARRPRPRGIAEFSRTVPECVREVSATED
jgi:hypothetical protein